MTTILNTADHATEQVKEAVTHAGAHARATWLDLSTQVLRLINSVREAQARSVDNVLGRIGLQRRHSALRPVLWFAAGAVAAGTAVVLTAPTSGKSLRQRIAKLLNQEVETLTTQAKTIEQRVEQAIRSDGSPQARKASNGPEHNAA